MNTSQCKIPVGAFYGHTLILPWQLLPSQQDNNIAVVNKSTAQVCFFLLYTTEILFLSIDFMVILFKHKINYFISY